MPCPPVDPYLFANRVEEKDEEQGAEEYTQPEKEYEHAEEHGVPDTGVESAGNQLRWWVEWNGRASGAEKSYDRPEHDEPASDGKQPAQPQAPPRRAEMEECKPFIQP